MMASVPFDKVRAYTSLVRDVLKDTELSVREYVLATLVAEYIESLEIEGGDVWDKLSHRDIRLKLLIRLIKVLVSARRHNAE
jgi:hypothetical protein